MFKVTVDNGVQAPYFVYGENSNAEWEDMKHSASPFSILRFPGRLHVYIQTIHVKGVTDMEAVLASLKHSLDMMDEMMGIPTNLEPGEEQLHYDPTRGGGVRYNICAGGGKSSVGAYYWKRLVKPGSTGVVYHEWGHGFCNSDLPAMGSQMYADLIREYVSQVRAHENNKKDFELYKSELDWRAGYHDSFTVLQSLVAFKTLSKGRSCVDADGYNDFPSGVSYYVSSYINCWSELYRLPLYEFGWDILRQVLRTDALNTAPITSMTDNMADLFCKATKSNLIPLFDYFNIKVSPSVAEPCKKQMKPTLISNYLKVANCIVEKDIMECANLPEFPNYTGMCFLS